MAGWTTFRHDTPISGFRFLPVPRRNLSFGGDILFAARQGEFYVMTELYNDEHQLETILDRTVLMKSLKPIASN